MPPKTQQKTKEQKLAAALAGAKGKKKKWSKGKTKEKANNKVFYDQETYNKLKTEIPKSKLITPSILVDRLKVNVSVARQGLRELEKEGLIRKVVGHHTRLVYTKNA